MNHAYSFGAPFATYNPPARPTVTHEQYMDAIRKLALDRMVPGTDKSRVASAKMVYGAGAVSGAKAFTLYKGWSGAEAFVEVAASAQTTPEGIAESVLHELGHVIAGYDAGHGKEFKAACEMLGLLNATPYAALKPEFDATMAFNLSTLDKPSDGKPTLGNLAPKPDAKPKACPAGKGTRGGKVGGKGSGSRLRLWECQCGVKVRVARDTFEAHCDKCNGAFERK